MSEGSSERRGFGLLVLRRIFMRRVWLMLVVLALGVGIGLTISGKLGRVEAQSKPGTGFAAVPGGLGSEDLTGPYEVVKNWPQAVSTLPGNEKWTYGAGESVFAESPNRIYMLFRRPHSVYISPYDSEKIVRVVDDNMQVIYRFTHDRSKLLQTIGTPEVE